MSTLFIDRGLHRHHWRTYWSNGAFSAFFSILFLCVLIVAPIAADLIIEPELLSAWTTSNNSDSLISRPPAFLRGLFVRLQPGTSLERETSVLRWRSASSAWLKDPLPGFPLGSSPDGRNIFWALILGAKYLAVFGIPSTLAGLCMGGILGILSSWWNPPRFPGSQLELKGARRIVGRAGSFVIDALDTFPRFILFFTLANIGSVSPVKFCLAFVMAISVTVGAHVRALIDQLRQAPEIQGAEERGTPPIRILWVHLVRVYLTPTFLAHFATGIALFVTWEATMTWVDRNPFGDDMLTWGVLLDDVSDQLYPAPWALFTVGLLLVATVLASFRLGEVLHKWTSSR